MDLKNEFGVRKFGVKICLQYSIKSLTSISSTFGKFIPLQADLSLLLDPEQDEGGGNVRWH